MNEIALYLSNSSYANISYYSISDYLVSALSIDKIYM